MKLYEIRLIVSLDNATGQHYLTENIGQKTALNYRLLDIQSKTVRGKYVEAFHILKLELGLNDKMDLCKYVLDSFIHCTQYILFYQYTWYQFYHLITMLPYGPSLLYVLFPGHGARGSSYGVYQADCRSNLNLVPDVKPWDKVRPILHTTETNLSYSLGSRKI